MVQYCECHHQMEQVASYKTPVFPTNGTGRMAARRLYRCPKCGKERITDGKGNIITKERDI